MERQITRAGRIEIIDFLRGFVLVSIFINHIPGNTFENLTHRNIGFSDAAEAFVFLSGLSVALAYGRRFIEGEASLPVHAIRRRIATIYGVQVLLSLTAILLFLAAAFLFDDDGLLADHGRDIVLDKPLKAMLAIAGLSHQIGYFNILPLYIVLLAATPALLALARRGTVWMLLASLAVYGAARILDINLPTWPVEGSWFLNPFAWQLLYCIGLFAGLNMHRAAGIRDPVVAIWSTAMVAFALLVSTNGLGLLPELQDNARQLLDISKTDLGVVRLLHFLALAYLTACLRPARFLSRLPVWRPLCLLGRHSLPVFAAGSVLGAIGQIVQHGFTLNFLDDALLIGGGIAILYLVAKATAYRRRKRIAALVDA